MQSVDGVLIVSPCHVEKLTRDIAKTRDIEIGVQPFFFADYLHAFSTPEPRFRPFSRPS